VKLAHTITHVRAHTHTHIHTHTHTHMQMWFLFCLIWGVGGTLDEDGRKKFDAYMRDKDARYPR